MLIEADRSHANNITCGLGLLSIDTGSMLLIRILLGANSAASFGELKAEKAPSSRHGGQ